MIILAVALADEAFEAYQPDDPPMVHVDHDADDHDADDHEQFGLGRGLGNILHAADPVGVAVEGRGIEALFPRPAPPAPPPMPVLPRGPRWRRVHASEAPRRDEIDGHLRTLTDALELDLAAHLRPGPGGGRLVLHRPTARSTSAARMDELCRAIRGFAAGRSITDDLEAGGCHCVAFGQRPLDEAGVYVFGRRDAALTMDERWAVQRRLAAAPHPS